MSVGTLKVEVVKAVGEELKSSLLSQARCRCELRVGNEVQSTTRQKIPRDKSKGIYWNESFEFDIKQPNDHLVLNVWRGTGAVDEKDDVSVGRQSVALNHLPHGKPVTKWYQLSNNTAIVQIQLEYDLAYNVRRAADGDEIGMTLFPVSGAVLPDPLATIEGRNNASDPSPRFIDYLMVLGARPEALESVPVPLTAETKQLKASVLQRYPLEDRPDLPLPPQIQLFCFPHGYHVRRVEAGEEDPLPSLHCFRITDGMLSLTGTVLLFWTRCERRDRSTDITSIEASFWVPRSICIISRYPYIPQFRQILISLYETFLKDQPSASKVIRPKVFCNSSWGIAADGRTFEAYMTLVTEEVPLPVPGKIDVAFELPVAQRVMRVQLSHPCRELDFPHVELSLAHLFQILDMQVVIDVLAVILTEGQILFHSKQYSILTFVQETVLALCFPFQWEHVFIPILPQSLRSVLQAPVPFIVGMHTSSLPDQDELEDASPHSTEMVIVDIDGNEIRSTVPPAQFPSAQVKALRYKIMRLLQPQVFYGDTLLRIVPPTSKSGLWDPADATVQKGVTAAFLTFLADLLQDYRNYVFFVNGQKPIFNTAKFLSHRQDDARFLSRFVETQLFTNFLDKHVEAPSYLHDFIVYINSESREDRLQNRKVFNIPAPIKYKAKEQGFASPDSDSSGDELEVKSGPGFEGFQPLPRHLLMARWPLLQKERLRFPRSFEDELYIELTKMEDNNPKKKKSKKSRRNRARTSRMRSKSAHRKARLQGIQVGDRMKSAGTSRSLRSTSVMDLNAMRMLDADGKRIPSSRLLVKSSIEEAKPRQESRLFCLVKQLLTQQSEATDRQSMSVDPSLVSVSPDAVLSPRSIEAIDVGEVAGVGELLRLQTWRLALVSAMETVLDELVSNQTNGPAELNSFAQAARVDYEVCEPSFKALTLLFNIALPESLSDEDFESAKGLLEVSGKVYCQPSESKDKEYLCYAIKHHKIWVDDKFWAYSFRVETQKFFTECANREPPSHLTPLEQDQFVVAERENFLFDLAGKFIYSMLSMGIKMELTSSFVKKQCTTYQMSEDMTNTLIQLAANIYMTAAADEMGSEELDLLE